MTLGSALLTKSPHVQEGIGSWAILLYLLAVILIGFSTLNLSSEALLGLATTLGVAFAFAFKDFFASLMAGIILLIDEPFQVGDRISFGGFYGEVTEIGLRSVRLVTLDDNLVTIPNSAFLTDPVASANAGALDCMVVIPIYVGAGESFYRARRLVYEAAVTSKYVYLEKPVVTQITDEFLGERFVTIIRVKAYVFDARFEKSFVSDVTERVKVAFRQEDIRMPDMQYRDLDLNGGQSGTLTGLRQLNSRDGKVPFAVFGLVVSLNIGVQMGPSLMISSLCAVMCKSSVGAGFPSSSVYQQFKNSRYIRCKVLI